LQECDGKEQSIPEGIH